MVRYNKYEDVLFILRACQNYAADLTNVTNLDGCSNGDGVRVIFSSSQSPFAVLLLLPKLRLPTSLPQLFQLPESSFLPALSRQASLPHSHLLCFISSRATLPVDISIGSSTDQVGVGLQVPFQWRRRRWRRRIELWGNCGEIRRRRFGGRHCVGFRRDRPSCRRHDLRWVHCKREAHIGNPTSDTFCHS